MLSLFGFGKRRKVKRSSKKSKAVRKPPARLLKICKKYHVKATKKVGGHRAYKSVAVLKRMCLKKARAMKKKMMKMMKRRKVSKRKSVKRKSSKRHTNRMGSKDEEDEMSFGSRRRVPMFGKRRGGAKVSKAKAMKAFRSFWKRHCKGRGTRFGNGGNPMLSASMGYEFCPNGMGGVLGANSTGLFPSSCVSSSSFGKRRRTVARKSRMCSAIGSRHRRSATGVRRKRRSAIGSRRRRTAIGSRRKRRSAIGSRRRRTAIGSRRRRRSATGVRRRRRSAAIGSGRPRRSAAGGVRRRRRYAA